MIGYNKLTGSIYSHCFNIFAQCAILIALKMEVKHTSLGLVHYGQ